MSTNTNTSAQIIGENSPRGLYVVVKYHELWAVTFDNNYIIRAYPFKNQALEYAKSLNN